MKRLNLLMNVGVFSLLSVLTGCLGIGLDGKLTADENGVDVKVKFHVREDGLVQETADSFGKISASTSATAYLSGQVDLDARLSDSLGALPGDADVVFVVDTTGSMGSAIEEVSLAIEASMKTAPDRHYGVVVYRDKGDTYVSKTLGPLGPDTGAAIDAALAMEAGEGGDFPEHVAAGLDTALRESPWRADKARHIILIGDAPDHGYKDDPIQLDDVLANAVSMNVHIESIAITCSIVCKEEIDLL